MVRHIDTYKDNQARYIRNDNNKSQTDVDQKSKTDLHQYDYLIPPMKKALKFTAKATWFMMKTMVKAAFKIPRLFAKAATPAPAPKRVPKKNPSPATAFPAP